MSESILELQVLLDSLHVNDCRLHGLQENRQAAELVVAVKTPHYWPVLHQQTITQTSSCDAPQTQAELYCAVIVMQYCPGGTLWAALQQGHFHNTPHKSDSQVGPKSCCCGVWPCRALPCQQWQTTSAEGGLGTALVKRQGQTSDRTTHHMSPGAQDSEHAQAACHSRPCRSIVLPQCQTPCANGLQSDNNSPNVSSPQPRLDRILAVAQQIAAALEHVHSQSVVHGDVTSHNVLLANRLTQHGPCVAKLADFGELSANHCCYRHPAVFDSQSGYTEQSCVAAFSCTLFQFCQGMIDQLHFLFWQFCNVRQSMTLSLQCVLSFQGHGHAPFTNTLTGCITITNADFACRHVHKTAEPRVLSRGIQG